MNYHREFEIAWQGLKKGVHNLTFSVDDKVLADLGYDHPDFTNLKTTVELRFEKDNGFFQLHFVINGNADVVCDRCGDSFSLPLWDEYDLIIKLTSSEEKATAINEEDEDADIVFMSRNETVINIFEWIYEFIMLSFPIQKIHPNRADGTSGCNPEALRLLEKMNTTENDQKKQDIWKNLQHLRKDLSNN